jgi:hypothetical protein
MFAHLFRTYKAYEIYIITFLLHCIWEMWQIYGENTKIWTLRGKVDTLTDTVLYMFGVFVYIRYFRKQKF